MQLWFNRSANTGNGVQHVTTSFPITRTNSRQLNPNTTDSVGGLGQFVLGDFVADAPSQLIYVNGNPPLLNGFQLREVAVPEPSLGVLLAAAALIVVRKGVYSQREGRDRDQLIGQS